MLAGIIALMLSCVFPNTALWLTCSAVMTLQLYSNGERYATKSKILTWSLYVAFAGATFAVFSGSMWVLWLMTISLISLTFYFGYQGSDRASVGLWCAVLIVINIFFPIHEAEWRERITLLVIGALIAYGVLFIKIPMRKKDSITSQLHDFLIIFQQYKTSVFHKLLFEEASAQTSPYHDKTRDALTHFHNLSETLPLTYNVNTPSVALLLTEYYIAYRQVFYWLVAIERLPKIHLPTEIKLCLEHFHTTIQSLSSEFNEVSDQKNTMASMYYWLRKMEDMPIKIEMTALQHIRISELYYLLKKLTNDLEKLITFLDSPTAKQGIVYLQRSDK